MARAHKILINCDPAQAKASREWQSAREQKKIARKQRMREAHEKQVAEAIANGVKVQAVPYNVTGKGPKVFVKSHKEQLRDAQAMIQRLEHQLAKAKAYAKHDFYDSPAWQRLRYDALRRANGCCELCGMSKADGVIIQVDHIKPRSLFPHLELEPSNLQVLCKPCNLGKSNRDATDWRKPVLKVIGGN